MDLDKIVAELESEITRLQHVRDVLLDAKGGAWGAAQGKKHRGRPKGSKNVVTDSVSRSEGKRVHSPEARKRIGEAMRRRWAERRKRASK